MSDVTVDGLRIVGASFSTELARAITSSRLNRTIDGGSTLEAEVADYHRLLITSPTLAGPVYADQFGLHFELVGTKKGGDRVTLTFEDAVAVQLKRPRGALVIPASSTSRAEIAQRLCSEAGVRVSVDPAARGAYNSELKREDQGDSWALLQSLASDIGWRCFSDGWQILFGSDEWLATLSQPLALKEKVDPVLSPIDFDMDVAKPASSASFTVAAERWALPPGRAVRLSELGWADGDWLVSSFERKSTSNRGTVSLVRRQLVLAEPPPEAGPESGEPGEPGYLPDDNGDISADLARLRQCESGGNYQTNTGNGYYGAYQFDVKTWQGLGYSGRPDQAAPATQDEAAKKLYEKRGWKPWPACSKKLGLVDRRGERGKVVGTSVSTGSPQRDTFVSAMLSIKGARYTWGGNGPYAKGWDCSGAVQMAAAKAGKPLGKPASAQAATVRSRGRSISVAEALRTRGALLFRIGVNGNHVAMSLGDGTTIEARGKADGCGIFGGAARRTWTSAGIWI